VGAFTFERDVLMQKRVPVTRTLRVLQGAPVAHTPTGFADVFDARWAAHVDAVAAEAAALHRQSAWLVGTFVDHEPAWSQMRLLDVPAGAPLRARWLALLNDRYPTLEALNAAWRTSLRGWPAARDLTTAALPAGRAAEDLRALEVAYADTYFSTVAKALKTHDPNHLYLGCRFARTPPANEEIARVAGKHVDVLSVNDPAAGPPLGADRGLLDRWHALSGQRPILVSQVRVPLDSPRQLAAEQPALPPAERGAYYVRLVTGLASIPYVVGAHWHQYADPPLTGRGRDGDNQIVGFVDVTDRPHEDLVAAAREAAARLYEAHAAAR
jgi:hypothetical protein